MKLFPGPSRDENYIFEWPSVIYIDIAKKHVLVSKEEGSDKFIW